MKHLKTFEGYHDDHLDSILDKINKSGMASLSKIDKDFLDAYKDGDEEKMSYIEHIEGQRTFTSNDKYFTFKYSHTEDYGDEGLYYYGTLTVPDLEFPNGDKIDGEIVGYIWVVGNGQVVPVFDKGEYDVLEFCNGLEYELDNFLDYVISTIEDEKTAE
jgi:hypothetical protein